MTHTFSSTKWIPIGDRKDGVCLQMLGQLSTVVDKSLMFDFQTFDWIYSWSENKSCSTLYALSETFFINFLCIVKFHSACPHFHWFFMNFEVCSNLQGSEFLMKTQVRKTCQFHKSPLLIHRGQILTTLFHYFSSDSEIF